MYIRIYVQMYIRIHVQMYIRIYVQMYIHIYSQMYVRIYVQMYIRTCHLIHLNLYIECTAIHASCAYARVILQNTRAYTHVSLQVHVHTHTSVHKYTCIYTRQFTSTRAYTHVSLQVHTCVAEDPYAFRPLARKPMNTMCMYIWRMYVAI